MTFVLFYSCISNHPNSTKLDSKGYTSPADRIAILEQEIKSFSTFQDAEFELFNVNGFHNQQTSMPGASYADYKFVVKIDTTDIPKWTVGMTAVELDNYDDSWTKEIIQHKKQNWETFSKPKYFVREDEKVTMLVFDKEGIIFKRIMVL